MASATKDPHTPLQHEQAVLARMHGTQDRIADAITAFSGTMQFVYIHAAWFLIWIVANEGPHECCSHASSGAWEKRWSMRPKWGTCWDLGTASKLYLPKSWTDDRDRCRAAHIPDERTFATKPDLAKAIPVHQGASASGGADPRRRTHRRP